MGRIPLILMVATLLGASLTARPVMAQFAQPTGDTWEMLTRWKSKTLGGRQYWTDLVHVSGWRIQRNANTGHCRVIDPENVRHHWGDYSDCERDLQQRLTQGDIQPNREHVVILMHGLLRTSYSMRPLARFLAEEGGIQAINVEYASSQADCQTHATDLDHLIRHLGPQVERIDFVAHSMGNIVIRRYLFDQQQKPVHERETRFGRMVMIGPPNQGSKMARWLKNNLVFKALTGVSGAELGANWEQLEPHLATPPFDFGIIAGAQPEGARIKNFMLDGPDDFTVALEETRLPGAADTLTRPLKHATMMKQPEVLRATLNFLQRGRFASLESSGPHRNQPSRDQR